MLRKAVVLGVVTLSSALGFGFASTREVRGSEDANGQVAAVREGPQEIDLHCAGGGTPELTVGFEDLRSLRSPDGERLSADLVVRHAFDGGARVAYVVEVHDDQGKEVAPPELPPGTRVAKGQTLRTPALTPSGLPDGFYQFSVRVIAISDAGYSRGAETRIYYQVTGGAVVELDDGEWGEFSQYNVGVPL